MNRDDNAPGYRYRERIRSEFVTKIGFSAYTASAYSSTFRSRNRAHAAVLIQTTACSAPLRYELSFNRFAQRLALSTIGMGPRLKLCRRLRAAEVKALPITAAIFCQKYPLRFSLDTFSDDL